MKALRVVLLTVLGLIATICYELLATSIDRFVSPVKHDMLGFGIYIHFTSVAFMLLLPLSIGLGELWWADRRRYIPQVILLVALLIWSVSAWQSHPSRTLLFVACSWATIPMRWIPRK